MARVYLSLLIIVVLIIGCREEQITEPIAPVVLPPVDISTQRRPGRSHDGR